MMPLNPLISHAIVDNVIRWYKDNYIVFPWRESNSPYSVWVSEIMLQQTTVKTVIPYYTRFIERFETVKSLAESSIDEVLTYWQGLGYYRRAHQLWKAANIILSEHGGVFPRAFTDIRKLPGIGDYTAAAIAAIAYFDSKVPVDGNVYRVFSRLFHIDTALKNLPKSMIPYIKSVENILLEHNLDSNAFAQGLMDLGREVCSPKSPSCGRCPVQRFCLAYSHKTQENLPQKAEKKVIPQKYALCYINIREDKIFLEKRPNKGLLSNLWQFPMTDFLEAPPSLNQEQWVGDIHHVFSHFKLHVQIQWWNDRDLQNLRGIWVHMSELSNYAIPTLVKKILNKVLTCYPNLFNPHDSNHQTLKLSD